MIQHNIKTVSCITGINYFKIAALTAIFIYLFFGTTFGITVQMKPNDISIGLGYNGTNIVVTGQCNPDENIVVRIASPTSEAPLKYLGKAGGLFWMKQGNMVFKPVPTAYVVFSPKPLEQLLPEETLAEYSLGYKALFDKIQIESDREDIDRPFWIGEFIKFKEDEKLYRINESAGSGTLESDGSKFRYEIDWPYQAPPGTYQLEAFAVKDRQVVDHANMDFQVKRSGIVSFLSNLAFSRAIIYGILAILVASLAGFSVGFIFKGGGAH